MKSLCPLKIVIAAFAALLGACISLPAQSPASDVTFEHLPLEDPLSQEMIRAIAQDRQGAVWFGTSNGLVKYDGYEYRRFLHDPLDSTSLVMNYVAYIIEDRYQPVLWLATEGGFSRFDQRTETFTNFRPEPKNPNGLSTKSITTLDQTPDGRIWLGTLHPGVLNVYDPKNDSFSHYRHDPANPNSIPKDYIPGIVVDGDGMVWGLGGGGHLFRLNPATDEIDYYQEETGPHLNGFWPFFKDKKGNVYFFTAKGIYQFGIGSDQFVQLPFDPSAWKKQMGRPWENTSIHGALLDARGHWWWGVPPFTFEGGQMPGLYRFDPARQTITNYYQGDKPGDASSIAHPWIWSSMEDAAGRLWFGLWNEGYNCTSVYENRMKYWEPKAKALGLPPQVRGISTGCVGIGQEGTVWMSAGSFLVSLPTSKRPFYFFPASPAASTPLSFGIIDDIIPMPGNRLWVNSFFTGYWEIGLGTETAAPLQQKYEAFEKPGNPKLSMASDQLLYVSTEEGVWKFDIKQEAFSSFTAWAEFSGSPWGGERNPFRKCQIMEGDSILWIGTTTMGLLRIDVAKKAIQQIAPSTDPRGLPNFEVTDMLLDRRGNIWIGLWGGGLYQLPKEEKKNPKPRFRHWRTYNSDLPSDNVYTILEDNRGALWMSTHAGISRFDPQAGSFFNYDMEECGQGFHYHRSGTKGPDGMLYFGGKRGLTYFHPDSMLANRHVPPVQVTEFFLFNKSVPVAGTYGDTLDWPSPLAQHISFTESIELPYWQNDLAFSFSALNYIQPENNRFAYILEGYQEDWIYTGAENRRANFTNLDPGIYTFRVKAANNDGVWNEEGQSILLTIHPPWWATWWAYSIYVLAILAAIYTIYRFQLRRQLEQAEARRLRELDEVKTRLYTNITHEFRTPLTIILGMAGQLKGQVSESAKISLQMIIRNGQHLLRLVNQLLDLRKLESQAMPVNMQQGNIIDYLRYLTESFHSPAQAKEIRLHFLAEEEELFMDYDPKKMLNIVSNLMSNAIKFTPEGGDVYLSVGREQWAVGSRSNTTIGKGAGHLLLKFRDTGRGIPEDKLPHIFSRFYQVDDSATRRGEGTGIGLALVKELVNLLKGEIKVKSTVGRGTEFTVTLPISREAPLEKMPDAAVLKEKTEAFIPAMAPTNDEDSFLHQDEEKPMVLIAEDNRDVVSYLRSCLAEDYRIEVAEDGQEGIDKAFEIVPDIIVTDVMMPRKDGFELCNSLKGDMRTSHIPIIMLTAKGDPASRIEGLERGADAYLAKPFMPEELRVRLKKMIELRKKLQAKYAALPSGGQADSNYLSLDERFMLNVRTLVEEHLSEEDFGIEQICKAMGISRMQLHRKLKALADTSASHYIRNIRLAKAIHLLRTTDLAISQVAYEVGFRHPSYFSESFTERYGMPPSEARK